jgi:hypothetical protein
MPFDLSQKVKAEKELHADDIKMFIKERLKKSCRFNIVSENNMSMEMKGRVKGSLLTGFKATFTIKTVGDEARISVNGHETTTGIAWILLPGFIITCVGILIPLILAIVEQNKPKETLEGILKAIDTEYSVL